MSQQYPTIAPMPLDELKNTLSIGPNDLDDDRLLNDLAGGATRMIETMTGPIIQRPPVTVLCEHVWDDLALLPDFQCPGTIQVSTGKVEEWTGSEWVEVTDWRSPPAHGAHALPTLSGWLYRTDSTLTPCNWPIRQPGAVRVVDWVPGRFTDTVQCAELEDGMAIVSAFEVVTKHLWQSWTAMAQSTDVGEYEQIRPLYPARALPHQAKDLLATVAKKPSAMAGARIV